MYKNNYVYQIEHKTSKKKYIGVHSGDLKPLEDIGVYYFTSSCDLEFYNGFVNNTNNYNIEIIENFNSREKAVNKEIELHEELDIAKNPLYYNKAKQTSSGFDRSGRKHSKKSIEEMSNSHIGVYHTKETRNKISKSISGSNHPMYGKKHTKESRQQMSLSQENYTWWNNDKIQTKSINSPSEDFIKGMLKGRTVSSRIDECVHCGISMRVNHLNRYHNDNCKNRRNKMKKVVFESLTIYGIEAGSHLEGTKASEEPNSAGTNTLIFRNGSILYDSKSVNSQFLMFNYVSASTNDICEAVFNKHNISGYSWTEKAVS